MEDIKKRNKEHSSSMEEDKKCKKELSPDAVAAIGWVLLSRAELYYREGGIAVLCLTCNKRCSEGSTIARMVWPPLSTIKYVSDTLRVFYLSTRAIEISFNLRTACRQASLRAFVYAVPDTRSLMPA